MPIGIAHPDDAGGHIGILRSGRFTTRPKPQGLIGDLQDIRALVDPDHQIGGHSGKQQELEIGSGNDDRVGYDVLNHLMGHAHLPHIGFELTFGIGINRKGHLLPGLHLADIGLVELAMNLHLAKVIGDVEQHLCFQADCKWFPEEGLFQTIIGNSPFAARVRRNFVYTDWSAGGKNPAALGNRHTQRFIDEYPFIVEDHFGRSEAFFARKFSDRTASLIDQLDAARNRLRHRRAAK